MIASDCLVNLVDSVELQQPPPIENNMIVYYHMVEDNSSV